MPIHYYLPKLQGEKDIKPPKTGCWEKQDIGIFNAISNAIEVLEKVEDLHVSSVPDIWARPLIFQSALKKNSQNPLRERFKQEWRGLLSLLALSKYKYTDVKVIPVEFDDGRFCKALRKLQPNNEGILLEKDTRYLWTDTFIIKYEDIPVGAFSPTTLVYTAVAYNERLKDSKLDLKDENGYLRPPVKGEEDYEFIGEWLETLLHKLDPANDNGLLYTSENNTYHKEEAGLLLELLKEWRDEIRGELGVSEVDAPEVKVSDMPLISDEIINKYSIYKAILCPLIADEETEINKERSDFLLGYKRNYSVYNEVVIITESLLKSNKRIWEPKGKGPIKLTNFGGSDAKTVIEKYFKPDDNGKGGLINGHKLDDEKAVWIRPERYFLTDTLLKGKNGDILTDSEAEYNADKTRYILPFKKEILDFFSYEDIKNDLKPQYKEDGDNVIFSFYLPLKDGGSERIERLYKKKGIAENIGLGAIVEIETPVIEIFPKYLDKHWRRYYLFHAGDGNISVNPVVFGRDTNSPRPSTESRDYEDRDLKLKIKITEISGDNAFPEGLEVTQNINNKQQGVGLVLLERIEKKENRTGKWKIGVDFGTSNTNIFSINCESSDNITEHWHFNLSKFFKKITRSADNIRSSILQNYFVPDALIELPSPTLLRVYDPGRKDKMLMLDYFAFFPSNYTLPTNVFSDIKWEQIERKVKYFIESVLFLILLEAVEQNMGEIEFAYSYPKAFSPEEKSILHNDWKGAFELILKEKPVIEMRGVSNDSSKIVIGILDNKGEIEKWANFEAEGIAAGNYFASDKQSGKNGKRIPMSQMANKSLAAICLDIGGGTTDISIWGGGNIVFDSSLRFAGRQISQLFFDNRKLCEILFSNEAVKVLQESKQRPALFESRLNLVLQKEEKTIYSKLKDNAKEPNVRWLRRMIALEFCAISYYSAILTVATDKFSKLKIKNRYRLLEWISTQGEGGIKLYWGGNAAKFIRWIDFGEYDVQNGIASNMLTALYYNCLSQDTIGIEANNINNFESPEHKSEVAGGLVVLDQYTSENKKNIYNESSTSKMSAFKRGQTEQASYDKGIIVCGENIELKNGTNLGFTDTTTIGSFFDNQDSLFVSSGIEQLELFIDNFNYFGVEYGLLKNDEKIDLTDKYAIISNRVFDFIDNQKTLPESKRNIEPIFIQEATLLMNLLREQLR